jgi:3-hydroxyacyl-CoA dehydrogenase
VVRAKDTPNFVANRIGIAGMLATIAEAQKFGLTVDIVDDLTGKKMGRASSGTFRTADVVGLDTMAHVIKTLQDNLIRTTPSTPATPRRRCCRASDRARRAGPEEPARASTRRSGQATSCAWIPSQRWSGRLRAWRQEGRPAGRAHAEEAGGRALKLLRESSNPQAQFVWAILRDSFHYVAVHLADIAESARDVDFAMRWGFGMKQGPFELWQEAGWAQVAKWVKEDIDAGKALCKRAAAGLGLRGPGGRRRRRAHARGLVEPGRGPFRAAPPLPVYARQPFPETCSAAEAATR